jgi:hypothetical protein
MPTQDPDSVTDVHLAAERSLIQRLAVALRDSHARADTGGFCLTCRAYAPCPAAVLAATALHAPVGRTSDRHGSVLVRAAITLLDQFETSDPEQARALLSWWPHSDRLTADELQAVIAAYRHAEPSASPLVNDPDRTSGTGAT